MLHRQFNATKTTYKNKNPFNAVLKTRFALEQCSVRNRFLQRNCSYVKQPKVEKNVTPPIWKSETPPQEFWQNTQNRRNFFDWLAKELRVNSKEDWLSVTHNQIKRNVSYPSHFTLTNSFHLGRRKDASSILQWFTASCIIITLSRTPFTSLEIPFLESPWRLLAAFLTSRKQLLWFHVHSLYW